MASWQSRTVLLGALSLASLTLSVSCTNSNLTCVSADCEPAKPAVLDNKVQLEGTVCTANPNSLSYPYKILFIVDVSGSTAQSDPTNGRGAAVTQVLNQYASNPEVSFAIISFESAPHDLEPTFTRDLNVLLPIIPSIDLNLGATDYLDTLQLAKQVITDDAQSMTAIERARTRYDVEWLSDGVPNPCDQIPSIPQAEQELLNLVPNLGLYDMRVSTIFLDNPSQNDLSCAPVSPQEVMQPMATEGRGTFQALTGAQLQFNIQFTQIIEPFSNQQFYVVNQSRVVKNNTLYADSDQDGVSDADEKTNGTDPTNPDTSGVGCGDRTNVLLAANPNLCTSTCTAQMQGGQVSTLLDTDADGLRNCEEQALGILTAKADTDGDNFIDSLETRFGTNANDPATITEDTDLDGITDGAEIMQGTDPLTAEPDRSLAYVYSPLEATASPTPNVSCYKFSVTNVQLVQTIATPFSKAGDNQICLYTEELPLRESSASSEPTVLRACTTANFTEVNGHSLKVPENGVVQFNSTDFTSVICNSGACAAPSGG